MKVCVVLLALLPFIVAAPDKRFVLDTLQGIIDIPTLKKDLQIMLDTVGSDPTEQLCEQECVTLTRGNLLEHSCALVCHSFQSLVQHFQLTPDMTTVASAPGKRFILDTLQGIVDTDTLKKDLQIMLDTVGSDPTEQLCEQECVTLTHGNLLEHSCPLLCHSFQSLVQTFQLTPDMTTVASAPGKRFVLDTLQGIIDTDTLKKDLQIMLDTVGSDPSEQLCEQECVTLTHGNLLEHSCPLLCHSFQSLVQTFQLTPDTTTVASAPGKRFILDTLQGIIDTDTLKKDLQIMLDTVGSDPSEQLCEQECVTLTHGNLLEHSCPLLCHSFQSLVQTFQLTPDTTTVASAPGKRFILDTLQGIIDTDTLKKDLQIMLDTVGSDPSEQLCEQECVTLTHGNLLEHSCPLLCHSFQSLVQTFQLTPDTTTVASAPGKRFILDTLQGIIDTDTLKKDLQIMLDTVGSDPSEQLCEQECVTLTHGNLLEHSCPLLCHSFQSLVQTFQLTPDTTTVASAPGKRFILDTLQGIIDTDTLKKDLQIMLDTVGSDPSEQLCEQECVTLTHGNLLEHSCPLLCHSFQSLVQHFQLTPDMTTVASAPGKRFILDTLQGLIDIPTLKKDLQIMLDTVGSDPTEQLCEQECVTLTRGNLLEHSCALVCHSFQSLVQHFQLTPDMTTTVASV